MKNFFTSFLGTIAGIITLTIIGFLMLIGIAASVSTKDKTVKVKDNSILYVNLNQPIPERSSKNPFEQIDLGGGQGNQPLGLKDIISTIEKAKDDERIQGIYMDVSIIPSGIATIEEVRNALLDFKSSEKFIVCYGEIYTQAAYYLASVADEIYINPEGAMEWKGLSAQLAFFKGTLEKLDIEMQVFKHGKFKSAVEPFTEDKMSAANREQMERILSSLWDHIQTGIAAERNMDKAELNRIADEFLIRKPEDAKEHGLVDGLFYKDELLNHLKEKLGVEEKDDINSVKLADYSKAKTDEPFNKSKEKIAVVYAVGGIQGGEGDDETIGSERISKAIRKARRDEDVKAIVLRVNSPGGSALASDVIWREVVLAKQVKPVVVSMGDVAASGGYYISCAADAIVAQPNTITGSIGVFGLLPNMKDFYNDKLGITFDNVNTNNHSDLGATYRAVTNDERAIIQQAIEDIYTDFIGKVAEGRGMTSAQVDSIGQGRVWSGIDAKEIGLVDQLGGIDDAIALAAEKAEVENYKLWNLPKQKDPFEEMIKNITGEANMENKIREELGEQYDIYQQMKEVMSWKGVQTRLPFNITIQ